MGFEVEIAPRSERESVIATRLEHATDVGETIYDFRGGELIPKAVSIPIALPVYRMENCRTFSAQQSEIATQGYDKDFFAKGQEKSSVQQVQHNILSKLAKHGSGSVTPIIDVLKKDGQREPILITHTGVVVNGNRRLSAMRELYRKADGSVDERFSHIKCAVLPPDITPDEIDDIEADLQARPQTKLDYDWIGDARLVRRQVNKGRTTKEVADRLRRSKADIENVLQALDEADLYLTDWANKPGQYELVSGEGEQIFGDIPKKISKKNTELQNASRAIAWSLFENREKLPGRVYSFNAAFGKLAPQILDSLVEELELQSDTDDDDGFDGDFDIDIDAEDGMKSYQSVIDALRNDDTGDAINTLIDVCESAIERDKGLKSEKAALKALSQANAKVAGVDVSMAGETTLPAMKKQIETIRDGLLKIEEKIDQRMNASLKSQDA